MYINDEMKEVTIDDAHIDLCIPKFMNIVPSLAMSFSILNCSKYYIYIPTERQKNALLDIQSKVLSAFMKHIANNLP